MLGAWVVRFLAYSALIVSAAIVLVLADVASVWAILLVIGAVWLLGAGLEWLIWRREQAGWSPYDASRRSGASPAPRRAARSSLRLPKISLRRRGASGRGGRRASRPRNRHAGAAGRARADASAGRAGAGTRAA